MGVILGSPLHQGVLAKRFDDKLKDPHAINKPRREQFEALYKLLDETGMPLPEMGLRFVISNPDISTVLVGSTDAAQMQQNLDAVNKGLPRRPDQED